jgi:hypothetical protein
MLAQEIKVHPGSERFVIRNEPKWEHTPQNASNRVLDDGSVPAASSELGHRTSHNWQEQTL